MSESQRAKYFQWNGKEIKCSGVTLPRKYFEIAGSKPLIENLIKDLILGHFSANKFTGQTFANTDEIPVELLQGKLRLGFYRLDGDFEAIVANPTKVGKPRYRIIKGQDIYSGNIREQAKGFIMDKIKECYSPHIENLKRIRDYPVKIKLEVHDTIKSFSDRTKKNNVGIRWDVDNLAYPYVKAFPDLLVKRGILDDDDRLHLPSSIHTQFFPIDNFEDRKLVFIIEKEDREEILNNPIFKEFHNTRKSMNTFETEDTDLVRDEKELDWETKEKQTT